MIEVQLLIPVSDNDGRAFDPAHDAVFEEFLAGEFPKGFTRESGLTSGAWTNPTGTMYRDQCRVYVVAVSGVLEVSDKLHVVVEFAKAHYRQEAICVRYLGVLEVL